MWRSFILRRAQSKLSVPRQPRFFTGAAFGRAESQRSQNSEGRESDTNGLSGRREVVTLAIETSCDDTSVAVLSISGDDASSKLTTDVLFHEKITAQSEAYAGIHPVIALHSHQTELGSLVQKAFQHLSTIKRHGDTSGNPQRLLDFISVTRGPGMRANLAIGLATAKGLATALNIPLMGVHHMQAHTLTSRLCSTLKSSDSPGRILHQAIDTTSGDGRATEWTPDQIEPKFPFLTILASGGHTMLIDSKSLTEHQVLAESSDIALGDCLDKAARAILLKSEMKVPYGKALEDFAFPDGHYGYVASINRQEELQTCETQWGWSLTPPFSKDKGSGKSNKRMAYSFAGTLSSVERAMAGNSADKPREIEEIPLEERREMAREVQRVTFEHVVSRILLHLTSIPREQAQSVSTIVVSGGVAANQFLRHVLRSMLDARGFQHIALSFPPVALCTDNALMIAWAGMEMYDAGFETELSVLPLRKWSMDPSSDDGGILGVGGWKSYCPKMDDGNNNR